MVSFSIPYITLKKRTMPLPCFAPCSTSWKEPYDKTSFFKESRLTELRMLLLVAQIKSYSTSSISIRLTYDSNFIFRAFVTLESFTIVNEMPPLFCYMMLSSCRCLWNVFQQWHFPKITSSIYYPLRPVSHIAYVAPFSFSLFLDRLLIRLMSLFR